MPLPICGSVSEIDVVTFKYSTILMLSDTETTETVESQVLLQCIVRI